MEYFFNSCNSVDVENTGAKSFDITDLNIGNIKDSVDLTDIMIKSLMDLTGAGLANLIKIVNNALVQTLTTKIYE